MSTHESNDARPRSLPLDVAAPFTFLVLVVLRPQLIPLNVLAPL